MASVGSLRLSSGLSMMMTRSRRESERERDGDGLHYLLLKECHLSRDPLAARADRAACRWGAQTSPGSCQDLIRSRESSAIRKFLQMMGATRVGRANMSRPRPWPAPTRRRREPANVVVANQQIMNCFIISQVERGRRTRKSSVVLDVIHETKANTPKTTTNTPVEQHTKSQPFP